MPLQALCALYHTSAAPLCLPVVAHLDWEKADGNQDPLKDAHRIIITFVLIVPSNLGYNSAIRIAHSSLHRASPGIPSGTFISCVSSTTVCSPPSLFLCRRSIRSAKLILATEGNRALSRSCLVCHATGLT